MLWSSQLLRSSISALRSYSTSHAPQVVLRPYQESALQACLDALNEGSTRIGVSLPTGSGKTTVFVSLLSRLPAVPKNPDARRSMIIVSSVELAKQAAEQVRKMCPDWSVEIEQGSKHHATGMADVTVATYQTLVRGSRLAKFKPEGLKAIIVDEAHHAAAPTYRHILSHFDTNIRNPDATLVLPQVPHHIPIFGFSATFSRHDGLALGSVFERIVYHRDFREMIKETWLCDVRFTSVQADIDLKQVTVSSRTGDFSAASLAHVINTDTLNKLVVKAYLDKAADRKSTLVFCVNLAHVSELTHEFREAGVDARYLHSGTPAAERAAMVKSFKAGTFPVLVNCAVLTEGTDIPNIDCVIVAKPTRSRNLYAQMIGRGMRLSPDTGKKDCMIIDFVDSLDTIPGVICTPTLFGLDPSEVIDDESMQSLEERAAELDDIEDPEPSKLKAPDVPDPTSVTYVDYDDPWELVDEASGAPHLWKLSPHAWVGCGGDIYILECLGRGFIRVEPYQNDEDETIYKVQYTPATLPMATARTLKIPPYQRSREIAIAANLSDAIRAADKYATVKVVQGHFAMELRRGAKWRQASATDSQKAFIRKRWKIRESDEFMEHIADEQQQDKAQKLSRLTKGEAANIITRLKHGAQSRYEKKVKQQQRAMKALQKERLRKAREHVEVGPLSISE
ncbi:P-loop containing nucleoside triphosphate hydrolase protein [Laetiporus sulphureus 93-53]|uniref:p-loop containing nucleoside triphosphate hydrolase protein n=1 Tax=Laetiporus sulphureus 93-53 TaxID=1314785 RepID=A0A165CE01_9APHY|nr:P-loop containing nucleoside triphosphate hydrolase protein [Laetiporus sulphureus 93-53]KZT02640.1 P-loop containing nucleoside triphosphate hydrolase protein [Laetiporus sulphureus 93-53]